MKCRIRFPMLLCAIVSAIAGCDGGTTAPPPGTDGGTPPTDETGRMVGMTAAHNRWRDAVGASPAIPHVTWSPDLAAVAQAYAESLAAGGCRLVHSRNGYGENLAWFGGSSASPDRVVDAWASELSCYSYGTFMGTDTCTSDCDGSGGCGHYTQVVWRDTARIGCGLATCPTGAEIWSCNYDPPGNFLGRAPY